jgi:hypothetical protein
MKKSGEHNNPAVTHRSAHGFTTIIFIHGSDRKEVKTTGGLACDNDELSQARKTYPSSIAI